MSFSAGGLGGAVVATARMLLHVDDSQVGPALQRNRADLDRATTGMRTSLTKLEESQIKVKLAQDKYTASLARFGPESEQAKRALLRLSQAEREVAQNTDHVAGRQRIFGGQLRETERNLGRATRGGLAASGMFSRLGRSVAFASASFLGGVGLISVLKTSIDVASNLHEQINKVDVVFGKSAAVVKTWSQGTATSLGIARDQSLEFAGTFGSILRPMGLAEKASAAMSTRLVKMAADLASFYNRSPGDALEALRAGLVGQSRPLRQFGILLSEDRVKAEALRLGIVKAAVDMNKVKLAQDGIAIAQARLAQARSKYAANTTQVRSAEDSLTRAEMQLHKALGGHVDKLNDAQKAQARYSLMLQDSKLANNDFSRTSSGLANQMRILHAQTRDLTGELGKSLMPTVVTLVTHLTTWLGKSKNQQTVQRDLNRVVADAATVVQTFWGALQALQKVLSPVIRLLGGLKDTLKLLGGLWAIGTVRAWGIAVATAGNEAATAGGKVNRLGLGLKSLPGRVFIQVFIVETIIKKLTGGGIQDSVAADAPGRANSPYSRGTELDAFWQAGYNGLSFEQACASQGVDPAHANPKDRTAWQKGKNARQKLAANGGGNLSSQMSAGIGAAQGALGTKYQWGGGSEQGPTYGSPAHGTHNLGYDCSGLAIYVLAQAGVHGLPHSSQALFTSRRGKPVSGGHLQPLDLVFYEGPHPGHVAVYMGNGWIIVAPHTGSVVQWQKVNDPGPPVGYRRFLPTVKTGTPTPNIPTPDPGNDPPIKIPKPGDDKLKIGKDSKKGKQPKISDLIPQSLQNKLRFARSTSGDYTDDIKAYDQIIAYLERAIKKAKTLKQKLALRKELDKEITNRRIALAKQRKIDAAKAAKAEIDSITSISDTEKAVIDSNERGGTETKDITDSSGKVVGREFVGTPTVIFDPATGKYIVVQMKPDVDALKAEQKHLLEQVLPKLDAEILATKNAIARLSKHKKKNQASLAQLRAKLKALQKERKEIIALANDLAVSIGELAAALALPPEPETTAAAETTDTNIPNEPGGDFGGSAASSAADSTSPAVNLPANIAAFLAGKQELVTGYASNVLAAAFAGQLGLGAPPGFFGSGSTITLYNYFASSPDDPHLFTKQLGFELNALGR